MNDQVIHELFVEGGIRRVQELTAHLAVFHLLFNHSSANLPKDVLISYQSNLFCCVESIVSREAIKHIPREVYHTILCLITRKMDIPWGYAFEHFWPILFSDLNKFPPSNYRLSLSPSPTPTPSLFASAYRSWKRIGL